MNHSADKPIVLITGCSSGFGMLTAARLSRKYQVIATMRDPEKQGALVQEVERRGGIVDIRQLDVTDPKSVRRCFMDVASKYGYLDVVVNNAGYGIGGFFEDLTDEEVRRQFETNFFGVQNVTRAALPLMRPRRSGKIIVLSSVAGFYALPAFGAYNASKWAVEGFCESLRYELKFFGIDVVLIEPGSYKTKIFYENAQYAKNAPNESSPYFPITQYLRGRVRNYVDDLHKDPEDIPALVEKLIKAEHPPFRSIPDIESQVLYALRRLLPFPVFSWMIESIVFNKLKERP